MDQQEIITFGCRLNSFESEVIRKQMTAAGLKQTVVFNTCAVTAEATRQARQAIRRLRREKPEANIIVTGCAAQIDPKSFADMPEVDRIIGNQEKLEAATYEALQKGSLDRVTVNDIMSVTETAGHMIDGFEGRARAFVQIQTGCDHRCTFCIIPYGRGNSRSVPMGEIVSQVRRLVEGGFREVVLTGVDLTSFGPDLPGQPNLGELVERLLKLVPDLERLRLSSIDCIEVDQKLMELITGEERLMPHLHLSLQSGDDMILKRMKRRHTAEDARRFTETVRSGRGEVIFGADFITGFPTETDEMFENTISQVKDCGISFLHVFPYSSRDGTPAARMPQVPAEVRKDRARRLRQAGKLAELDLFDRLVGKTDRVLVEKTGNDGLWLGHTEGFAPIRVSGDLKPGEIVPVRILPTHQQELLGEIIDG